MSQEESLHPRGSAQAAAREAGHDGVVEYLQLHGSTAPAAAAAEQRLAWASVMQKVLAGTAASKVHSLCPDVVEMVADRLPVASPVHHLVRP